MAKLTAAERAALPDRAFAYIDGSGRRRLPIDDASHVRNALARFDQVQFESDAARDRALRRLLAAARRFRIVPVGFVDRQIRREREHRPASLPGGFVTMLMTDIEGSTGLLDAFGDRYGDVLDTVRSIHRVEVERVDGVLVGEHADDVFAAFELPSQGVAAALSILRRVDAEPWPDARSVRVRAGLHAGYPTIRGTDYVGMAVHTTARICEQAQGGQLLTSDDLRRALDPADLDRYRLRRLGSRRLRGIPDPIALHRISPRRG